MKKTARFLASIAMITLLFTACGPDSIEEMVLEKADVQLENPDLGNTQGGGTGSDKPPGTIASPGSESEGI